MKLVSAQYRSFEPRLLVQRATTGPRRPRVIYEDKNELDYYLNIRYFKLILSESVYTKLILKRLHLWNFVGKKLTNLTVDAIVV